MCNARPGQVGGESRQAKPRRSASTWVRAGAGRLVKSSSARSKKTAAATSSDQRMRTKNASAW